MPAPFIALSMLLLAAPPTLGPAQPLRAAAAQPGKQAELTHCLVSLIEDVQVPAREAGALVSVVVKEGDFVKPGQLLAQIDDQQPKLDKLAAELQRNAALAKAEDDIEVRYADAAFAVTTAELERGLAIERRSPGGVTQQEIQKLQLAKRRDELQIERSKLEMHVAKMNADVQQAAVKSADDAVLRRQIVSPIDGVVVTRFHEKGEWVASGESVVEVVRIDRLRVEGFLDATEFGPDEVSSRPVMVEVQLAGGRPARFAGSVVYVSPLVLAGNKHRIWAEVENRSENGHPLLRPGMEATMTISLGSTSPKIGTIR